MTSAPLDKSQIESVLRSRVYFGHQSVGGNILSGVTALRSENKDLSSVKIAEVQSAAQVDGTGIYHSRVGKNRDTDSKIKAFEEMLVDRGVGDKVDMAMLKFCYVDVYPDTDVESLFKSYNESVERIQKRVPTLKIVHTTVPVTVHGGGLKKALKNWLKGDLVNVSRAKYNTLIREKYGKTGLLFDIAEAESTLPDGSRATFNHKGELCEAAAPVYTDGTGHLNDFGAKTVGALFLQAIAQGANASKT